MATQTTARAGVAQALSLTRADVDATLLRRWRDWTVCASIVGSVSHAQALRSWIQRAQHQEREIVLRNLINMASARGDNDDDAAQIVAWLMLGPACVLARKYRFVADIDHHVAANLWLEIKQYDGRLAREVWSNLASRVRNRLFTELATRSNEVLVPAGTWHERFETPPVAGCESFTSPDEEVMAVLESGVARGVITFDDQLLLLDVVAASASVSGTDRGGSLMGDRVSDVVGLSRGVSGRTIRRRVRSSITRLSVRTDDWPRSA